jgi:DNA-binding cell septation regulator SpoVG
MKIEEIAVGDVIALNHFPHKPFKVVFKDKVKGVFVITPKGRFEDQAFNDLTFETAFQEYEKVQEEQR